MRFSCMAMLVLVSALTADAQHGGGGIAGSRSSGPPNPYGTFPPRIGAPFNGSWAGLRPTSGPGWRPTPCPLPGQGCHNAPPFWRSGNSRAPYPLLVLGWNGWPAFGGYGFNNAFDPGYAGPDWPLYAQPPHVPVLTPPPVDVREPIGSGTAPEPAQSSTPDPTELRLYRTPAPPPDTSDDHPPLIALKNRWAYTALKYWVSGKTFHFITTQGDHMQVPTTMVDRIYPTPKPSQGRQTKPTPTH